MELDNHRLWTPKMLLDSTCVSLAATLLAVRYSYIDVITAGVNRWHRNWVGFIGTLLSSK